MRCDDVGRLLDDRRDGRLTDDEDRDLAAHLESCPDCRAEEREREETADLLRTTVDAFPQDPGFPVAVMDRVRAETRRGRRRGALLVGAGALTAAAAVLLLLAVLESPPVVRVDGTEGGLLRVQGHVWRALGAGDRVEAGAWFLTFPDRRATLAVGDHRVLVHGDTLAGLAPGRIDLLRGRLLLTAGPEGCRVETPYGGVEAAGAVVALALRYDREPVIRLGPDGTPQRTGALLLIASASVAVSRPSPPPGHLEITVVEGEAAWWSGERRGRLAAGQRVRLGPDADDEAILGGGREPWMTRPLESGPRRALRSGEDPLSALRSQVEDAGTTGRLEAARRLGRLCGGREAADTVASRLDRERDPVVRSALLDALHRLGATDHAEVVGEALRDPWPEVRAAALLAWEALAGREGAERIGQMIDDPEPRLRVLALEALERLGNPAAKDWARKALEDPEPAVVEAARKALRAMGA